MNSEMKYIESSMSYCPWKTRFIESYEPLYLFLMQNLDINKFSDLKYSKTMLNYFFDLFFRMMQILQKKLKDDGVKNLRFYTDIIVLAEKNKLISDKKMFFEIIKFSNGYFGDNKCAKNFKPEYIKAMTDFYNTFSLLSEKEGFRVENYEIIDNRKELWGLKKKYYNILIENFKSIEKLKIVRIFGSRVTTNYKEFSDIDLILEGVFSPIEFQKIKQNILNIESPYIRDVYNIYSNKKPFIYRNTLRSNIFYERKKYFKDDYISVLD